MILTVDRALIFLLRHKDINSKESGFQLPIVYKLYIHITYIEPKGCFLSLRSTSFSISLRCNKQICLSFKVPKEKWIQEKQCLERKLLKKKCSIEQGQFQKQIHCAISLTVDLNYILWNSNTMQKSKLGGKKRTIADLPT